MNESVAGWKRADISDCKYNFQFLFYNGNNSASFRETQKRMFIILIENWDDSWQQWLLSSLKQFRVSVI